MATRIGSGSRFFTLHLGLAAWVGMFTVLLGCSLQSEAASLVWTNSSSGSWSNAANWSPNQIPTAADQAYITNAGTYAVTVSDTRNVGQLRLGGGAGLQSLIQSGGSFTAGAGSRVLSGGQYTMNGGRLLGSLTIESGGLMEWGGSNDKLLTASLTNAGTARVLGGDVVLENNIENQGMFELVGGTRVYSQPGQPKSFANKGTLRKTTGTGTADVGLNSAYGVGLQNTGTVECQNGTLNLYGAGVFEGTFLANAGTTINLLGPSYTQTTVGKPTISGAGLVQVISGTISLKDTIPGLKLAGGTLQLQSDFQGTGAIQNLTLEGMTLVGTNTVTGTLIWAKGRISGPLTIAAGGVLSMETTTDKILSAALINSGTARVLGGDLILENNVENHGVFELVGGTRVYSQPGQPKTFVNKGTLRKTTGTGTGDFGLSSAYGVGLQNTGTVECQTGTLNMYGLGTLEGTFLANAGTTINLLGPSYTQTALGKPVITGAGLVQVINGTISLKDNIPGLKLAGGTLLLQPDFQGTGAIQNLTLEGMTLVGTNTVTGTLIWAKGRISGPLTIAAGGVLSMETTTDKILSAALTNSGTARVLGGDLVLENNIENQGLFELVGGTRVYSQPGQPKTFVNKGTLRKTTGTGTGDFGLSSAYGVGLQNTGTVECQTGTLNMYGLGTLEGTFLANAGTTINLLGPSYTQTALGKPVITGAGLVQVINGTISLKDNIPGLKLAGGTLLLQPDFQGTGAIQNLTLEGMTLVGTNTVTGTLIWTKGRIGGSLTIAAGGVLSMETTTDKILSAALTNAGTARVIGGDLVLENNIENQGLFELVGGTRIYSQPGQPKAFANKGTLRKSAGTSTADVGINSAYGVGLQNTGTVECLAGILNLYGVGTLEGVLFANAGTTINLLGPSYTQTTVGKPTISGDGLVQVTGGTLSLKDNIPGLKLSGGTLQLHPDFQGTGAIQDLILDGMTLTGTNTVTGTLIWTKGRIGGSLTIAEGGVLSMESSSDKVLSAALTNAGTTRVMGGDLVLENNIENQGLLELVGGTRIYSQPGQPKAFSNKGTLRKTTGTANCDVGINAAYGVSLQNSGTIDVRRGSLTLFGGYTSQGGTLSMAIRSLTDYGRIHFPSTVALAGTLDAYLVNGYVPVANNSFSVVTFSASTGSFDTVRLSEGVTWQTKYDAKAVNLLALSACSPQLGLCVPTLAPRILEHPSNVTTNTGATATFNVLFTGLPAVQYQWSFNGSPLQDSPAIQGSRSNLLTLTGLQKVQSGLYTVTVSNGAGSATSLPAVLQVRSSILDPVLTPATVDVILGQAFAFTVEGGTPPFVFSMPVNNSGATLGAQNGIYIAGSQPGVTDTVQVTDSKGLTATATARVITDPTPRPDLAVHQLIIPAQAIPGTAFPITWTLTNRGPATALAPWQDYVLLSADAQVGSDTLIAGRTINQSIPPGGSLTVTQQVTLPVDGPSGTFRVVLITDVNGVIQETNELNNAFVSASSLQVPQQLVLTLATTQLREDAPNPNVVATLRRNGSTGPAVSVNMSSSANDEVTVPSTVVIPAGQQAIQFPITIQPDGALDGDQSVVITGSAAGFTTATATIQVLDADVPTLSVGFDNAVITEGASVVVTVSRPALGASAPLTASFICSEASQFTFPATVVFAAGQLTSKVNVSSINDSLVEQTNTYTFTAKGSGYISGTGSLKVIDNDLPSVSMTLVSSSVSESAGGNATALTITRQPASVQPLQLLISSADTNIARVPISAVILPGQTQVSVPVAVIDNKTAEGTRTVALGAWVREGESGGIVEELPPVTLAVTDDEGPTLLLTLAADAVGEGLNPATSARITRNTSVASPLTVTLASSDTSEATVPATVVIPAGTNAVSFPIATLLDGTLDGNQTVVITASAAGYTAGKANLVVSDADLPDLVVASVKYTNSAITFESIDVTYRIENRGNKPAVGPFGQRVFLSSDAVFGDDLLMSQTEFGGILPPGGFFESTLRLKLPNQAGDFWFMVQTDQGNVIQEILEANNVLVPAIPVNLTAAYTATVDANPSLAPSGTPIQLTGRATKPGGAPAASEVVLLRIMLGSSERTFQALTDAQGNYVLTFKPLPGEGGNYFVSAAHPGVANPDPQTTFTLLALKAGNPTSIRLVEGESGSGTVTVGNLADISLTGLTVTVTEKPPEITVTPSLPSTTLGAQATAVLGYAVSVANGVSGSSGFRLRVESSEGARVDITVPVVIDAKRARLVAFPGSLEGGMKRGTQRVVEFGITNVGGLSTGPIRLLTPGVSWLNLASSPELPPLQPGAGTKVSVLLTPPTDLPLGAHAGSLAINASNTVLSVPYNFRSLSDAVGSLRIRSVDEYTYYAEGAPNVSNAVVRLTDAITGDVIKTNTGPAGELLLPSLVESYYYVDVSAEDHSSFRDLVLVEPGKTNLVTGLMSRQSVKYSWTVVPIQIEDRYTITVETIFETAVPKPVVTIEPNVIDLANFVGSEQQVNLTLKNHGLIAAQNTKLSFPQHSRWSFTPLVSDIGVLPAQSTLVIPLTIRKLVDGSIQLSELPAPAFTTRDACSLPAKVEWDTPCGDTAIHNSISLGLISMIPGCFNMNGGESGGDGQDILGGLGGLGGGGGGPANLQATAYPAPIFHDVPYKCEPCEQARFNYMVFHCLWNFIPYGDGYDLLSDLGDLATGGAPALPSSPSLAAGSPARQCLESIKQGFAMDSAIKDCLDVYRNFKAGNTAKGITSGMKCSQLPSCKPGSGNFIKILECEMDMMELTECKGKGPGGLGGGGAPPLLLSSGPGPAEIPVEASIDPFDSAAPLLLSVQRLLKTTYPARYFYGDDEWVSLTNPEPANLWLARVGDATEIGSPDGELISASERAALLSGELPVVTPIATQFLDRIQQTLLYARRGITRVDQVPAGESIDFIAADELIRLIDQADAASKQIAAEGFETGLDSVLTSMTDYLNRLMQSSGGAVCAKVKVRLDQEAVLTRDAFNARLEITNETGDRLEELSVEIHIRTLEGGETTPLFQIRAPELTGTTSVTGTGFVQPQSTATASWVIVPTSEAAPTNTVQHFVSGTLRYRQNGVLVALPLSPAPIDVLPNPKLVVKYFHERDVFSDDPFTPEVEPAIPYSLAVLVSNEGYGVARQMRITSAQPKIVDNEKGLLIDFEIIGSEVGGQPSTPSLAVNLGDIQPQGTSSARWLFKSSLQGLFIDYKATFEHLDGLGDKRLSLIDRVEIHEMNHVVRADRTFEDQKLDFLVNDVPDFDDLPDTLHLSSGGTRPVAFFNEGSASPKVSAYQLTTTLTTPTSQGWAYFRIPDPASGKYRVVSVRRADNSLVPTENVWQTDRTFIGLGNPPRREFRLHLLDYQSAGTYTITYQANPAEQDLIPPVSSINPLPAASPEAFALTWDGSDVGSGLAGFDIFVRTNVGSYVKFLDKTSLKGIVFQGRAGERYSFYSVAIDVAGNREAAPTVADADTLVSITNAAPVITYPASITLDEGVTLDVTPTSQEPGSPGVALSYSLITAPPGVTIQESSGRLNWLTGEGNGPSTNQVWVRAGYPGYPLLNATSRISVVIREINRAPELDPIDPIVTTAGFQLDFALAARDFDLPPNKLTYALLSGAKAGVSLNGTTGRFKWRPESFQAPSTNQFTVSVTDNASPSLSATQRFTIVVRERRTDFSLHLGTTNLFGGEQASIPIRLTTGVELQEVVFTLSQLDGKLSNLTLGNLAPQITSAILEPLPNGNAKIRLTLSGLISADQLVLANLRFTGVANIPSALVRLQPIDVAAVDYAANTLRRASIVAGVVALVNREPVVHAVALPDPVLTVYGLPGKAYLIETRSDLLPGTPWFPYEQTSPLAGRSVVFQIDPTETEAYFRAVEQ